MPITVQCACGAKYNLKEDQAGKTVKCRECGSAITVPAAPPPAPHRADPVFGRDKFLLRQKHMALTAAKYTVFDEQGEPILYVERPYHILRTLLALAAAVPTFLVLIAVSIGAAGLTGSDAASMIVILVGVVVSVGGAIAVGVALSEKRHVMFFRDQEGQDLALAVEQHRKMHFLTGSYSVWSPEKEELAVLRKHYIYNIFRKRWKCHRPDGSLWFVVKEDSLILSLSRRLLGPLLGILRTNFVFMHPETKDVIGEFNRKFTILDRYVLDMSEDQSGMIDRRVAVAMGVMLDTGERR